MRHSTLIIGGRNPLLNSEAAFRAGAKLAAEIQEAMAKQAESDRSAEAWESYAIRGLPGGVS